MSSLGKLLLNHNGYRFRIVAASVVVFLLVIFLYPFQSTTVPEWNLRVVDDAGAPVREINVTEHWQDYMLETEGHEEVRATDQDGRVSFGQRSLRASLTRRLLARISKFGKHQPEGRAIRYGAVVVWGNRSYETTVAVNQGEIPPAAVHVRRR
ncbi:MAG TPA: hypothetical protein VGO68_07145 [Pyrinomonadaceae bacterium]|nr:hypothetical protein [Pyrinomonadaceae bacterium]